VLTSTRSDVLEGEHVLTSDVPGYLVSPVGSRYEWSLFISSSPSWRGAIQACYTLLALSCLCLLDSVSTCPIQYFFTFVSMPSSVARSRMTHLSSS
jgi:hypothetical protein